jgi:hypothetical protein
VLSILNGLSAQAANFSVGALLNSQWTCIDPNQSTNGPINEIKVAELVFAPTTVKKDKTFTTVTFTKFNLQSSKGLYTLVALAVFTRTKTYKQAFIPIKPIDGVQKLNFSVKVPTKEIKEIVLNISIQNPKNQKVGGSCIPTKVFEGMLPISTPQGNPIEKPVPENYVRADFAKPGENCSKVGELSFHVTGPMSCANGKWNLIEESKDSVASSAYRSLIIRWQKAQDFTPNLLLRIDPAAGEWKNNIVQGINAGARLWGTSNSASNPIPAYVSENSEYISENLAKDGIKESAADAKRNRDAAANGGAQAGFHGSYFDFIFSKQTSNSLGFYQVGPHEYTHYSQMIFSNGKSGQITQEPWISEGCASFVGTNMGGVLGMPQNQRSEIVTNIKRMSPALPISSFSQVGSDFFSQPNWNQVYDAGTIGCEALAALGGIDSIEALYRGLADPNATYDTAARKVYGVSLQSLVSLVQKYINSVKEDRPLTLNELRALKG